MINKFNDILEQFAREIDQTVEIFDKHRDSPPVTKNQPPVAGAIKWARSLLARVKQTMAKLTSTEEEIIRTTGGCGTSCFALGMQTTSSKYVDRVRLLHQLA